MKLGAECSEALLTGVVSACRRSLIPACRCGGGRGWVPTSSEESVILRHHFENIA